MWALLSCEYWRDGGSYSATLRSGDRTTSLWLQVSDWDRVEDKRYEALFLTDGSDATLKTERVQSGDGELAWLAVLNAGVDPSTADQESQQRFAEFVVELGTLCQQSR
jgi:hypothetical protein